VLFNPEGVGRTGKLAESHRQTHATRTIPAARQREPYLMRRLRPDPVELQRGNQANDSTRHPLGRFHQRLVLVAVETCRGIETASELAHLRVAHQPTQILAGVSGYDHVAGTEYPQPTGMVASGLEAGSFVTFYFHLQIYGGET